MFTRGGVRGVVDDILQLLAGLEVRDFLRRYFDPRASLRVATHPRLPLPGPEASETPDFDLVTATQRFDDTVENSVYDHLGFFPGHLHNTRYFFNQIGLGHLRHPHFLSKAVLLQ